MDLINLVLVWSEAVVRRCSVKVLRNFANFTGKHLCQRLFFNKVAGPMLPSYRNRSVDSLWFLYDGNIGPATLLEKTLWHRCFPVNFPKFLRTPFFTEHLRWLFLFLYTLITLKIRNFLMFSEGEERVPCPERLNESSER